MNVRSITIASAVLVMSTVAGFGQDWTKNPQDWTKSPQVRTQNPETRAQTPQNSQPLIPRNRMSLSPSQSQTQDSEDWTQNLYAHVGAGILYQQNTTLYQSTTTPKSATLFPGVRGDIALGYNINKSWAVELDTGLLWTSMDKVGGVSLSSNPYPFNASFDTYTVPLLASIVYKVPINDSWLTYAGVGFGGAATIASYSVGNNNVGDYSFALAYQAEVGLKYTLTQNASMGIAYDFFGMTNPSWYFNSNLVSNHIKEDGFYTHSLTISFTWSF